MIRKGKGGSVYSCGISSTSLFHPTHLLSIFSLTGFTDYPASVAVLVHRDKREKHSVLPYSQGLSPLFKDHGRRFTLSRRFPSIRLSPFLTRAHVSSSFLFVIYRIFSLVAPLTSSRRSSSSNALDPLTRHVSATRASRVAIREGREASPEWG